MTTETFDPVLAALAQRIKAAVKAYTEAERCPTSNRSRQGFERG